MRLSVEAMPFRRWNSCPKMAAHGAMGELLCIGAVFRRTLSSSFFRGSCRINLRILGIRKCHSETVVNTEPIEFGLLFDIDGVITRGRTLLPHSKSAFKLITDDSGKFLVPTIFVTNAGNSLRQSKAKQLSEWLDIHVDADQVVMSHSPLRMFKQSLDKHVLLSGQGPVEEIARNLGFSKVTTMDTFRQGFPSLDTVDHKRRKAAPCAFEKYFPKIEAIVLFGEPVRWETSLQLIIDILVSNGRPSDAVTEIPYPHIPILACNMDLLWMSEAPMPRIGHGCFMNCLESLYKKITGFDLKYTAKVGKPSEITYHYAEHVLQSEARQLNLPRIRRMYCIGDNPAVDVYGANLFSRRIRKLAEKKAIQTVSATGVIQHETLDGHLVVTGNNDENHMTGLNAFDRLSDSNFEGPSIEEELSVTIETCESILVCTGVFDQSRVQLTDHIMDPQLCVPSFTTVHNALEAVRAVFEKEGFTQL